MGRAFSEVQAASTKVGGFEEEKSGDGVAVHNLPLICKSREELFGDKCVVLGCSPGEGRLSMHWPRGLVYWLLYSNSLLAD